eukprot:GEMP01053182.1.p1 GENE.GEMP01053182.1~~GEMP01053182.1.p1  ORF type:complete len:127 (-),score=1.56 GEMP01053182.1:796-1176(-)
MRKRTHKYEENSKVFLSRKLIKVVNSPDPCFLGKKHLQRKKKQLNALPHLPPSKKSAYRLRFCSIEYIAVKKRHKNNLSLFSFHVRLLLNSPARVIFADAPLGNVRSHIRTRIRTSLPSRQHTKKT